MAHGAAVPRYSSEFASGADVQAAIDSELVIESGGRALIPTGLALEIPIGYEVQVRSRSGLASKYGIMCLNSPGTIDSDYRGEIKVILANFGDTPFIVSPGDRIAQLVLAPVYRADFIETELLSKTARGEGGFGSTGI
jgi:dUTP pyrophosphatase